MTIFLLTRNFPPVICGVGDYTFELYQRLKTKGYNVKVITGVSDEVERYVKEKGIESDIYTVIGEWNFKCIKQIVSVLRRENASWFCVQYAPHGLTNNGIPIYIPFLLLLVSLFRIKTAIFFHEIAVRLFHFGAKSFAIGVTQRGIAYLSALFSTRIMTNNLLYQGYLKPFNARIVPVPANIYKKEEVHPAGNTLKKIRQDPLRVISFLNRCDEFVLKAVMQCSHHFDIHLYLVGQASESRRKNIIKSINDLDMQAIVFVDQNTRMDHLANLLIASDVYLQIEFVNSNGEGGISTKSGALAAAMASGLPVISVRGDMTDDLTFKEGENILFARYHDAESIFHELNKIASSEILANRLSSNSSLTYNEKLSWNKTLEVYCEVFDVSR